METSPHPSKKHFLRSSWEFRHLLGMLRFQFHNGRLGLIRASPALENMSRNLSKTVGKAIDIAPEELSGIRSFRTMNTLQASIANSNIISLAASSLTILFSKPTNS
jgi:hypothetical protein